VGADIPLKVDPAAADGTAVSLENEDLYSWDLVAMTPEELAARGVLRAPGDPTGFGSAFAGQAGSPSAVAESEAS
jgi:hypothetical protein